ncbi:hypothetical protein BHE74_00024918 [Ensete ventricosum]|uniref:Uncharacterized protein n=1 Tax=Ensete ventricosum TaxID=4639 RepID=A0A427AUX4_ENSVE|nr:hypothetical protein B296_00007271 [Ensete ventricosum]RWW67618.1 hypothetical protein BHE74_00024918 [Ensete ventricosum]RZR96689.1 hypothetical protein BHM03_00025739 [Ensete ventricosum]
MKDICGMWICKDDEDYYVLHMANWALRDSCATMQARWPNLSYQAKVWDNSEAASEFGRLVTHIGNRASLFEAEIKKLKTDGDLKQLTIARQRVDELTGRLEQADKELNELREGLAESQRHMKIIESRSSEGR